MFGEKATWVNMAAKQSRPDSQGEIRRRLALRCLAQAPNEYNAVFGPFVVLLFH